MAAKILTVNVTTDDITAGATARVQGELVKQSCALARVIRQTYPTAAVYIGAWRAIVDPEHPLMGPSASLPEDARRFISAFDHWSDAVKTRVVFQNHELAEAIETTDGRPAPASFRLPVPA